MFVSFAGYRDRGDAHIVSLGSMAYLWSSSPFSVGDPNSWRFIIYWGGPYADDRSEISAADRGFGYSVRCVYDLYDFYEGSSSSLTLTFTGSK